MLIVTVAMKIPGRSSVIDRHLLRGAICCEPIVQPFAGQADQRVSCG
jgi:hypothetical protein